MGTTHFKGNLDVGGNLTVGSNTNSGSFKLPSLTTTERNALTVEGGLHVYDSTLGYDMVYRDSGGWGQTGGGAATSLDGAYDGGMSIEVDAGTVALNDGTSDAQTTLTLTKDGVVDGASNASIFHINSTANHTTSGTVKMLEISVATEGAAVPIGAEIAMYANTDSAIYVTKGAMILYDGALTLTSGALTLTSGNFTYTAGDMTMADGSLSITDADAATTLTIVNDSVATADLVSISSTGITTTGAMMKIHANAVTHDGMVLELVSAGDATSTPTGLNITIADVTTGTAKGIDVVMAGSTTQAKGISVTMAAITTGNMLYLDASGASMTGAGRYINCNDDDASMFSVAVDGATVIAGTASGSDALTLTAGDILVTSGHIDMTIGDLTLADGSVSITDADAAASLSVVNNTITTTAAMVDVSSTSLTTGALMRLNANTTAHDGEILELINAGDAGSTGTGLSITMSAIATGAGEAMYINLPEATSGAKGISVKMAKITTSDMLYLDASGATLTEGSGCYINCNDDDASEFAVQRYGETTIAGKAAGTDALTLDLGDLNLTDTDTSTITSVNGTGDILTISGGGVTGAGNAMLVVTSTGTIANGAFYVDITSGAAGTGGGASYLLHVDATHANIEAIHVDAGTVLFDEGLTVTGTLTQTGVATFATGVTQTAVSRTPGDGTGTAAIAAGTSMVNVTGGASANVWLALPTPVVGHIIWLLAEGTGYEIRSNAPQTVAINGGTHTAAESAVTAGMIVRLVCTTATTWVGSTFAAAGTEAELGVAAQ